MANARQALARPPPCKPAKGAYLKSRRRWMSGPSGFCEANRLTETRTYRNLASEGGCPMRSIDFTPLYRSVVGFDRLAALLDAAAASGDSTGYPPYNIETVGDDAYRIEIAVAGF